MDEAKGDQATGVPAGDTTNDVPVTKAARPVKKAKEKAETLPPMRFVGKTVEHYEVDGRVKNLVPNTVYRNLPGNNEQLKKLIKARALRPV